jgi:hypothetical protein
MEGFYVYRENRLIHYGDWLGMFVSDPHLSLLRINFSFDHTLDDAFNVDIKKSRILLNEDIYEHLKHNYELISKDINFKYFFEAMKRHTYENINDSLYDEMKEKFYKRIKNNQ